ncbi:vWA domain-containing protein [Taibaiella chishuiensis]|uniref:vWA domain-containing protein n=1 Tax=Taibaiella chishuiensis TaxID=1434707 RepID=UPI0011B20033|nr:hypothetical protein [Taibaiella chishuiensis]
MKRTYNIRIGILLIISMLAAYRSFGQPEAQKPARILFLLDASSSMLSDWQGRENRFHAASRIIGAIADSIHGINPDVAFALRVYGNQFPAQDKNCYDSRLEVPFGYNNVERIQARLRYLHPMGFSPIAWSLAQTAELDFTESNSFAYSIVLITDGGESCGGDICATVTNLLSKKISFKPYILSLVEYEPLRQQYACLGKYLTVATEKDIIPAVKTIIGDNRVIFSIRGTGLKTIAGATPPPTIVPVKMQPRSVAPPKAEEDPKPATPKVVQPEPRQPVVVKAPAPVKEPVPVKEEEPRAPARNIVQVDRIRRHTKLLRLNNLYVLPDPNPVTVPRLPRIKIPLEEEPRIVASTPPPATNRPPVTQPLPERRPATKPPAERPPAKPPVADKKEKEEPVDFLVKQDEAQETTAQIYFTNGQGKFYLTEPRMIFRDSKTQKEIKSVYRNVSGGEPTPIKIPEGTYDIVIPGSKAKASNVTVAPNKTNKIYIKVGRASLAFHYSTAPKRPVKEYTALVSKRFEGGPVVKHRCDEELPYDPTNYHVEINTLPPTIYNVDLNFNEVKLLDIPEAGTLEITNTVSFGKVQFWYRLGDAFVPFLEMMINGNTAAQRANLLPGAYQVRYFKRNAAGQEATVRAFSIKSNAVTQVQLEP